MERNIQKETYFKNTQKLFILTKLLISPLEAMFGLLVFIFYKELNASPFEITLLVSLRPIVSILSFYSHLIIRGHPYRLKQFLMGLKILGILPCFFFPFSNNLWLFITASLISMSATRAALPAWSEIMKINLLPEERGKIFSQGSSIHYLSNLIIPLLVAPWIDWYPGIWKWFFACFASIQLLTLILLSQLKLNFSLEDEKKKPPRYYNSISDFFLIPWKNSWELITQRKDFREFQIVFFLGGSGLMLVQPVLPVFFKETLHLSYTELTIAFSFCKGLGFTLASPIWANWFHKISIQLFNVYVTLFAAFFGLFTIFSTLNFQWIYIAYLTYGAMQAGSELSWNLSGPQFSQKEDSTLFTGVNIAMVGLRGCLVPWLGQLLFFSSSALTVFICSSFLCLSGSIFSLYSTLSTQKEDKLASLE